MFGDLDWPKRVVRFVSDSWVTC